MISTISRKTYGNCARLVPRNLSLITLFLVCNVGFVCFGQDAESSAHYSPATLKDGLLTAMTKCDQLLTTDNLRWFENPADFYKAKSVVTNSRKDAEVIFSLLSSEPKQGLLDSLEIDRRQVQRWCNDWRVERDHERKVASAHLVVLISVGNDLYCKRKFLAATKTTALPLEALKITANTLNDEDKEVPHCTVFYVLHGDWNGEDYRQFDNPSTPVTNNVPPGDWDFWSERNWPPLRRGVRSRHVFDGKETSKTIKVAAPPQP